MIFDNTFPEELQVYDGPMIGYKYPISFLDGGVGRCPFKALARARFQLKRNISHIVTKFRFSLFDAMKEVRKKEAANDARMERVNQLVDYIEMMGPTQYKYESVEACILQWYVEKTANSRSLVMHFRGKYMVFEVKTIEEIIA